MPAAGMSVLMPTKDSQDWVAHTLQSLWATKWPVPVDNVEVIVRDEGTISMMESRSVRQVWDILNARVQCRHVRVKEQGGLVVQRRELLKLACQPIVWWIDDDLIFDETVCGEILAGYLKAEQENPVGFSCGVVVDTDNLRRHADFTVTAMTMQDVRKGGFAVKHTPSVEREWVSIWRAGAGYMARREDLQKHASYDYADATGGEGEDAIATMLLADKVGPGVLCRHVLVYHMVRGRERWKWTTPTTYLLHQYLVTGGKIRPETWEASDLAKGYKTVHDVQRYERIPGEAGNE